MSAMADKQYAKIIHPRHHVHDEINASPWIIHVFEASEIEHVYILLEKPSGLTYLISPLPILGWTGSRLYHKRCTTKQSTSDLSVCKQWQHTRTG